MSMLLSFLGGNGDKYCPDCGSGMNGKECPECGYGSEENDMEEEDDSGEMQALIDIKDELQRVMEKVNRLIVKD